MRSHAKASSAGSTERQGGSLSGIVRGAFATRGGSSDADGSGAPSRRGRLALLSLVVALTGPILLGASALASKQVVTYFGESGDLGGQLGRPGEIAVNTTGAGGVPAGTIYVADENLNRVQRFTPDGSFVSAWGADVVQTGGTGDRGDIEARHFEICTVAPECKFGVATGGNGTKFGNGALAGPRSVAVDGDTGNVYVSDSGNFRINEYSATGAFIRSFGWDVVRGGDPDDVAGTHEKQTVKVDPGLGGSFTLKLSQTTAPIAADASAFEVKTALQALPSIGLGNVDVSGSDGGPWTVEFTGSLADRDIAALTADPSGLSVPVGTILTCSSSTSAESTAFQWLSNVSPATGPGAKTDTYTTVAADAGKPVQCQVFKYNANGGSTQISTSVTLVNPFPTTAPTPPAFNFFGPAPPQPSVFSDEVCVPGDWGGNPTFSYQWYRNGVAIPGATSVGYALKAADVPGVIQCAAIATNAGGSTAKVSENTITQGGIGSPEAPGGNFGSPDVGITGPQATVTVDANGAAGGYEVCQGATSACISGKDGSGVGQIGSGSTLGIAVSQPDGNASNGTVFLADPGNRRINTYNLDGVSPSSLGSSANFGTNQPRRVAVDSRGILYASDSNNGAEIDRYDTKDANGGGIGFLTSITAANSAPAGPLLAGPETIATSGLAVDPDSDGVGSDEDVLYVLRDPTSGNTVVQQFGPSNDPGLSAAPAAVDDTHGAAAGFDTVNGLGVDNSSDRFYVSASSSVSGIEGSHIYVLDDSAASAEATINPVTTFDAHSATLSGTVDPNGSLSTYHFEYVKDADFQLTGFTNAANVPLPDASVGKGEAPVSVQQQTPESLIPGTLYHARLVAKRLFDTATTIAGPVTFTTEDAAPSIYGTAATVEGEEEATLRGTINPENEATSYHFEWGATNVYGNNTSVGNLSATSSPTGVSTVLTGLTPGASYHYRLMATNGTDTTKGPDRTFTTPAGPPQFPQRAYELASYYPTGGIPFVRLLAASEDGDRVQTSGQPPPGTGLFPPHDQRITSSSLWRYGSVRGPGAWSFYETGLAQTISPAGTSRDGKRYISTTGSGWADDHRFDPDDQNGQSWQDLYQRLPDGTLVWISRDPRIPVGTPQTAAGSVSLSQPAAANMSVDGRTVAFSSQRQLLDADTTPGDAWRLYKWTDGELSFIGKRPDGSVPRFGSRLGTSTSGSWSTTPDASSDVLAAVSRDGSRAVFGALRGNALSQTQGGAIYIQTDGQSTVEATKETGVPPLPPGQPYATIYRGASADGSRVFFSSASRFTPDSGATYTNDSNYQDDLYVYDIEDDEVRDLTPRLDGIDDSDVDPAVDDRGRLRGLIANSEDGKRVYFVADAQYQVAPNPEGDLPSPEGRNLYLAEIDDFGEEVELRFVAALGSTDGAVWQAAEEAKAAYAAPDGSVLSFGSWQPLTGQGLNGTNQLFVYDAKTDTLACASCPPDGSLPVGNVNKTLAVGGGESQNWQGESFERRWVGTDGTVFFHTPSPLVEEDSNLVEDVYEYRDGRLGLVSAGTSSDASRLESISRDGSTVFVNTLDALVPWDEEPGVPKLYAARVGGGFPNPIKPADCDLGAGACEGAGTKAPASPGAGTAAFQGSGNTKPTQVDKRCPKGRRKVRRQGKVRCVPRKSRKQSNRRTAKNDRRAGR